MPAVEEIYLSEDELHALDEVSKEIRKNPKAFEGTGPADDPEATAKRYADREAREKKPPIPASVGTADNADKKAEQYRRLARDAEQAGDRASARIYLRQARDIAG